MDGQGSHVPIPNRVEVNDAGKRKRKPNSRYLGVTFHETTFKKPKHGREKGPGSVPLTLTGTQSQRMHEEPLYETPVEAVEDPFPVVISAPNNQKSIEEHFWQGQTCDGLGSGRSPLDVTPESPTSGQSSSGSESDSESEAEADADDEKERNMNSARNEDQLQDRWGNVTPDMIFSLLLKILNRLEPKETKEETPTVNSVCCFIPILDVCQGTHNICMHDLQSFFKRTVMEQVLNDKECGLYPSENTWKAIVDIVHGKKENLIGYSAHLSDVCVCMKFCNLFSTTFTLKACHCRLKRKYVTYAMQSVIVSNLPSVRFMRNSSHLKRDKSMVAKEG